MTLGDIYTLGDMLNTLRDILNTPGDISANRDKNTRELSKAAFKVNMDNSVGGGVGIYWVEPVNSKGCCCFLV